MTVIVDPRWLDARFVYGSPRHVGALSALGSMQLQPFAGLRRGGDARAHRLDDAPRLLDQLGIARVDTATEVQVVLEPDAHVAAEQHRLRRPRHLHPAD